MSAEFPASSDAPASAATTSPPPASAPAPGSPTPVTPAAPTVSAVDPDWSRERTARGRWEPGKKLLRAIRRYQRWRDRRGPIAWLVRKWAVFQHRIWSIVCACDIPINSRLGGGLSLPHPNGIVIHPDATVGPNCLFFQQVTLGHGGPRPGVPTIGGHVDIGAGARILGGVRIGDHARIGANAVVLSDIPEGATAVGIPARVLAAAPSLPAACPPHDRNVTGEVR